MNRVDPAGNDDQTPTFSITVIASTTDYTLPLFVNPNAFTNYYAGIGVAAAQAALQQWYNQLVADRQQAHDAIVGQDLRLAEQALKKPDCAKHFGTAQTRSGAWDPTKVLSTVYSDKEATLAELVSMLVSQCTITRQSVAMPQPALPFSLAEILEALQPGGKS